MPSLDVSSVVLSTEFVTRNLTCTRNTQTVGDDGIAVDTPTSKRFAGTVTNDTGDILIRAEEGERIQDSITIHTRFKLVAGKNGRDSDVVTWCDNNYTVVNTSDWSTWGRGFVAATCQLIPLSGGK